jgi:hypothetical protein
VNAADLVDIAADLLEADAAFVEQVWRESFRPPDRRPIYEAMASRVALGNESPFPGEFDVANSPMMKRIFEALLDDEVNEVSVSAAAQSGKTLLALLFLMWVILENPGSAQWNAQTESAAKKLAETKLWPLWKRCRDLQGILPRDKNKARTLSVIFPHMPFHIQPACENNAHGDSIKIQINDERHLWADGLMDKFRDRTTAFWNKKILNLSTGSLKYGEQQTDAGPVEFGDDFFTDWHKGTQEVWAVPCPECGQMQELAWIHEDARGRPVKDEHGKWIYGIVWDENETTKPGGRWNYEAVARTARWRCRFCDHEVADNPPAIRALNAPGDYIVKNPWAPRHLRSFRWPAMASELISLGKLVVEWLQAQDAKAAGNLLPLRRFFQNRLARFWNIGETIETASEPTADYLIGEEYEWLDEEGKALAHRRFMTVDRQKIETGYFWLVRDWSIDGESRKVAFGRAATLQDARAFQLAYGVLDKRVLIDTSFETIDCYQICLRYGWTALKGDDQEWFNHEGNFRRPYSVMIKADPTIGVKRAKKSKLKARRYARLYKWSNPTVKDLLAKLRAGKGRYWGRPSNEDPIYTDGIDSEEKRAERDEHGRVKFRWKPVKVNNHPWDLECMQVVAALMSRLIIMEDAAEEEDEPVDTEAGEVSATAEA